MGPGASQISGLFPLRDIGTIPVVNSLYPALYVNGGLTANQPISIVPLLLAYLPALLITMLLIEFKSR